MSYREYYVWCPQNAPALPPPPAEQINARGMQMWTPQPSCTYSRRPAADGETPPHDYAEGAWPQGRYMPSSEAEAARVRDWYRCDLHPGERLEAFRQRAAYDRRYDRTMGYNTYPEGYTLHYRVQQFGTEIPWPDHVAEDRRDYRRYAYFPVRPPARSTASLWA